ncbi:2-succinyl-6-hydroxy-2,4-cyclohexadiene-1-carboxylate synthase [Haloferula luteola]|uniref:2-succinyl-6-hydroxy-2, 4-cyclohexadiene-1-carboxylate synthase n=1 Tax=Haloferula luteola TaxID=595692 RepID=A0A840V6N9_9BACT|nr:alpha/beta fold hydrolase [Haloferula luteola]MBB5352696.1 2-succinyl-6-hydroxy-2,4-cyclohexadiene-1-carboxylate synthase [Haloferula luteola]
MEGTLWCLHGGVGMAEDWRGFSVPGWAVKRVDLWRFLDCCPMSLREFGRALNDEAAARSGRKVLMGYSMGGRLALHALMGGGSWDAAVVISAHPGLEDLTERATRRARDAEWAARALKSPWSEFLEAWNRQAVLDRGSSATELRWGDRSKLELRRASVARSFVDWSLGAQDPLWGSLLGIRVPLLWVAGEEDGKFRALAERAVACGGFDGWLAPGSGHRVPWESSQFPSRVGEFLERSVS